MYELLGSVLKKRRKEKHITQKQIASELKISQGYIADLENGKIDNPSEKTLFKIGEYLGFTYNEIIEIKLASIKGENYEPKQSLTNKSNIDLSEAVPLNFGDIVTLPIVGTVRAGQPILAVENIQGSFPVDKRFVNSDKEYFFLRVKGDSMNMEFNEGSLLLIEKCPYIENGEIGVVLIDGQEATVKKIVRNENMVTLISLSTNPEYQPKMYDIVKDDVQIIGKVKFAIKQY